MGDRAIGDELIDEWREAGLLLCMTNREATRWGNRYLYRGLRHLSNDEVRACLNAGGELISPAGIVALLEVHGVDSIEQPLIDGWGREGLLVILGDDHAPGCFVAVSDLGDADVEAELAAGGRLLTCDELLAGYEEHHTFESPPYPGVLTHSWHAARKELLRRVGEGR